MTGMVSLWMQWNKEMKQNTEQAYAIVQVGLDKTVVCFKLDTGADINVIPTHIFRSLGIQYILESSPCLLYCHRGEQLIVRGKCNIKCQWKDIQLMLKVHVVITCAPPVPGLKEYMDFGLIKLILLVSWTPKISVLCGKIKYLKYRKNPLC